MFNSLATAAHYVIAYQAYLDSLGVEEGCLRETRDAAGRLISRIQPASRPGFLFNSLRHLHPGDPKDIDQARHTILDRAFILGQIYDYLVREGRQPADDWFDDLWELDEKEWCFCAAGSNGHGRDRAACLFGGVLGGWMCVACRLPCAVIARGLRHEAEIVSDRCRAPVTHPNGNGAPEIDDCCNLEDPRDNPRD